MAEQVPVEEVANAMYKMVKESMGQKKWKATDLTGDQSAGPFPTSGY